MGLGCGVEGLGCNVANTASLHITQIYIARGRLHWRGLA